MRTTLLLIAIIASTVFGQQANFDSNFDVSTDLKDSFTAPTWLLANNNNNALTPEQIQALQSQLSLNSYVVNPNNLQDFQNKVASLQAEVAQAIDKYNQSKQDLMEAIAERQQRREAAIAAVAAALSSAVADFNNDTKTAVVNALNHYALYLQAKQDDLEVVEKEFKAYLAGAELQVLLKYQAAVADLQAKLAAAPGTAAALAAAFNVQLSASVQPALLLAAQYKALHDTFEAQYQQAVSDLQTAKSDLDAKIANVKANVYASVQKAKADWEANVNKTKAEIKSRLEALFENLSVLASEIKNEAQNLALTVSVDSQETVERVKELIAQKVKLAILAQTTVDPNSVTVSVTSSNMKRATTQYNVESTLADTGNNPPSGSSAASAISFAGVVLAALIAIILI